MEIVNTLIQEFNIKQQYVSNIIQLVDDGNTIPFIARYRKELTGSIDDQILIKFVERLNYLRNLQAKKAEIIELIREQDKLTQDIILNIDNAKTISELDDIYRPFRPKRKTRASIARDKGLQPLADFIKSSSDSTDIMDYAKEFINSESDIDSQQSAIQFAMDIISEEISDSFEIRTSLKKLFFDSGVIKSKAIDPDKDSVYLIYYDFSQAVKLIPSTRVLAINRAEKEKILKVSIDVDSNSAINIISREFYKINAGRSDILEAVFKDALDRLLYPSIEREIRNILTESACEKAIYVFKLNLRQLLMQPPVKKSIIIGIDPGFRTGCKLAVIDHTGKVLDVNTIYPTPPNNKLEQAANTILELVHRHNVDLVSIGNGTASRETEVFIAELIKKNNLSISYLIVSEAGASVYSASEIAAKEFPTYDVSLRGAISIARRVQDPLAELVKIDTKSIGVGQYQHDMVKSNMDQALNNVVESCVNQVGVELNTASFSLLSKVSGISNSIAKNIVEYRDLNGSFKDRQQLKKVKGMGKKTFQQSAGFLRILDANNILDRTAVHPELYSSTQELLNLCGFSLTDINTSNIENIGNVIDNLGRKDISDQLDIGLPTLSDIIMELIKPSRDPRDDYDKPIFRSDVLSVSDLHTDMVVRGTVRNIVDFGAFVDIGVSYNGLLHISEMGSKFISHPSELVSVGNIVDVKIKSIDYDKNKISLTMK